MHRSLLRNDVLRHPRGNGQLTHFVVSGSMQQY